MDVPKLRFKEFTDDWKSDKISNLTTYVDYRGKTPVKTETGTFLITAKNVKKGYIDYNCSKEYVEASQYNAIMHRGLPKVGDVLVTTEAPCGNVAQIDNANVALAQRIIKYRGNDLINNDFLKYELLSDYFQTELKRVASGGTVYGVKGSTLHQMSINYCSKEEQTKIAQFLSLLDKKIELQTKKIEALKLFKLCILKHIFSSATVKTKLKNISNIAKGEQINSEELSKSGPYYMLNGGTEPSGYLKKYNTLENTITISEGGNSCGYVKYNKYKFWCGGHCYSIKNKLIDNHYLYQLLKFNEKKIMRLRVGSGLPNIQKNDLENFELFIHEKNNQYKIANMLMIYDTKIELEKNKLDKLTSLKTGLMQNMFI